MKRIFALCALAAVMLAGCADTSKIDKLTQSSASRAEIITSAPPAAVQKAESIAETEADTGELIDLTVLDGNMVYAQVFDMVNYPDTYIGQPVKAKGTFAHTVYNGKDYYAVLIADAAACCSQGMEFELNGDYVYPDDYPELDTEIIIEGTFNTYEEDGCRYCQLTDAVMTTA